MKKAGLVKKILFLMAGLVLGFAIGRLLPFNSGTLTDTRSGLNVHTLTGFNADGRSLELSEYSIITIDHILWYDWKSNIFALDAELFGTYILEDAIWWDQGYRFVVTVDGVIAHVIRYADPGTMPMYATFALEPTIFPDRVLFHGDAGSLDGYDGSLARIYSIDLLGFRGRLNTRIYYELAREGRLLEQVSRRYILAELDNVVGQSAEGQFAIDSLSIVTFEPAVRRAYTHDPIIVTVTDISTGEIVFEFTHLFSMPVSFVMEAGEYGINVSGGGFVRDSYSVSGIVIPEL